MQILADTNVPEEYVSALRGDDHDVIYSHAESEGCAILSTDVKDFGSREAEIPVFVAPQHMAGGDVRAAIARIEAIPFDPAQTDPLWLSGL